VFGRGFDSHRLHYSFAFFGKTLLNQRFLFLSLVFLGILLRKKELQKESFFAVGKNLLNTVFKKNTKKDTTDAVS